MNKYFLLYISTNLILAIMMFWVAIGLSDSNDLGVNGICDPTYQEVMEFIAEDQTNDLLYSEACQCVNFAQLVNNNAEEEGIHCGTVFIKFVGDCGHTVVCFNTTDCGVIFVEPQTDAVLEAIEVGKDYHDCNGALFADIDQTISEIVIYW